MFSLSFTKLSSAAPVKYLYFVETQTSLPISLSWYMADEGNHHIGYDLEIHKVGTSWKRHYCFELPGTVGDWQVMTNHRRCLASPQPILDHADADARDRYLPERAGLERRVSRAVMFGVAPIV